MPVIPIQIRALFDQTQRTQIILIIHNPIKPQKADTPDFPNLLIEPKPLTNPHHRQNDSNKIEQIRKVANIAYKPKYDLSPILFSLQPSPPP